MPEKKTDEEVLFPEAKVGDIVIKPWSFGKLFELAHWLDAVLEKAENKGLVGDFEKATTTGFLSYVSMAKLFAIASDEVLEIIASTVDRSKDEIKSLDMTDGVKIAITIFQQNKETIKNALAPLLK